MIADGPRVLPARAARWHDAHRQPGSGQPAAPPVPVAMMSIS
jgi:hypothetical protein